MKTVVRPETEMKESGLQWLGEIPNDWKVSRVGNFFSFSSGDSLTNEEIRDEGMYLVYGANGIRGYYSKYNLAEKRILLGRVGALAGNVHIVDGKVWVTEHALIASNKLDLVEEYYGYVFESMNLIQYSKSSAQPVISGDTLQKLRFPVPKLSEQQAIADYLDETCSKIDEIIAEAKASIDEYKELKQSVIFEAVTKGLDKNVEMKQCSVNWLDEIPSTWESIRLKYLLTEINNRSETGTEQPLSVSQVMGVVPSYMIAVANPTASYVGQKIVEPNDIVFNKLKAHLGVFFMSKYHGLVSPDYAVYRTNDKVIPKYLEYLFHTSACISEFKKYISGVAEGLMRLYTSDLFNIRICLPKVDEQIKIVEYVENKVELFDSLISEKESLINDLEAYKKSLIYEVVTGKRRVV
ncbi:restriction endonuclease subunit S [Blautia sp.]|uniref:restriction endonuclease subunit S n=1 Tax=Blautia sp. TaxID=1955243 RepID=UPI003AB3A05E